MTWSSVLLQSAAIFSCRLLQSTGPELLHHTVLTKCLENLNADLTNLSWQPFFFVLTNILKDQPELWTKTSGSQGPGRFAGLGEAGANLFLFFYGFC